jgi:hypothetical protein
MELDKNYFYRQFDKIKPYKNVGSSESFLFTAIYNNNKVLLKFYTIDDENMIFEIKIYVYLSTLDKKYKQYFISCLGTFKINIKHITNLIPKETVVRDNMMYCIVLDYINNYVSLHNYLTTYALSEQNILNIMFQVIYIIYMLNHKLDIIHNDFHFDNIFIKEIKEPFEEIIEFNEEIYKYTKYYDIIVYDFDCSTKLSNPTIINKYLDDEYGKDYGSFNKYTQKDAFIFLAQLIKYNPLNEIYDKLFNILTQNKYNLKVAFRNNLRTEEIFWSAYAPLKGVKFLKDCSKTEYPDLDIKLIFKRFLKLCKLE